MDDIAKELRRHSPGVIEVRQATPEYLEDITARAGRRRPPAAPTGRLEVDPLLEAWGDFLAPYFPSGGVHLTGTYSDEYGYRNGLMLAHNVVRDYQAFLKSMALGTAAGCVGVESHPRTGRKVLHLHSLIGGTFSDRDRHEFVRVWESARGWARATEIFDREGCIRYAAKHLLKQDATHFTFWTVNPWGLSRHARRQLAALFR